MKFTKAELDQLMTYAMWAERSNDYYGPKKQFEGRHVAIVVKLGALQRQASGNDMITPDPNTTTKATPSRPKEYRERRG